jgi:F-type H+-transporting ATPase subunit gamma
VTRLAEIEAHAANVRELRDIVGAMRALAGMRVQEATRALAGVRQYAAAMAAAIGEALLLSPSPPADAGRGRGRGLVVVFTAEHGFAGAFNEHLLAAAQTALARSDLLFVVGSRGLAAAAETGRPVAWSRPMATRPNGAAEVGRGLAAELYRRIAMGGVAHVGLVYARWRPAAAASIEHRPLLPLDPGAFALAAPRQKPLHNLAPQALLETVTAEYVFALLTEAIVDSIASENAARFAAMAAAHDNVSKKLDQLRQAARQARQDDITTELLDLVTGAEAMAPG